MSPGKRPTPRSSSSRAPVRPLAPGGLVSYGPDYYAQAVQAAGLVAKIIRGARPSDVPVEGADRIELAVNLKTTELPGLTVPRKIIAAGEAHSPTRRAPENEEDAATLGGQRAWSGADRSPPAESDPGPVAAHSRSRR
jgi:ABC transporter substrate binding protein